MQENTNNAVSRELLQTIKELQSLPSLRAFCLAGGTNLAFRYNHRISTDIDLFNHNITGIQGLNTIKTEIQQFYSGRVVNCQIINEDDGDQFGFLRAFVRQEELVIKVEIIQNMKVLDAPETINDVRLATLKDIGLFKLMSACNRKARKDIYDIDLITDIIPLPELLPLLEEKKAIYNKEEDRCLFDLDDVVSPNDNLDLLLAFDTESSPLVSNRPFQTNDIIDIISANKSWRSAKFSWRRKVRDLMHASGHPLPEIKPVN